MASRAKARGKAALQAMKDIGIPEAKTKPVLKKLLNLFEKNWELIEEENYRLLADSIFEYEDAEAAEKEEKKKTTATTDQRDALAEESQVQDEVERPLKRLRLKHQGQASPSHGQPIPSPNTGTGALKIPKPEPGEPEASPGQRVRPMMSSPQCNAGIRRAESQPVSPQSLVRNKGKQPISPQNMGAKESATPRGTQGDKRASRVLQFKEPKVGLGVVPTGKDKQKQSDTTALIKPKDEPFTDDMLSLEPLAVVLPEPSHSEAQLAASNPIHSQDGKLFGNGTTKSNGADKNVGTLPLGTTEDNRLKEADVGQIGPANIDIVSSSQGEVRLCLNCIPGPYLREVHAPDVEAVLKKIEDNCIKTYKVMSPEFSVRKLMRDLCEGILECGTNVDGVTQERASQVSEVVDEKGRNCSVSSLNGSITAESSDNVVATSDMGVTNASRSDSLSDSNGQKMSIQFDKNSTDDHCDEGHPDKVKDKSTRSLVVVQQPQQQLNLDDIGHLYDMTDITKGEEEVKISLEKSGCESVPSFRYITQNVVSQNAHVIFSLVQIGDQDCCTSCDGDCLSSSPPCYCAQRGGESPYTADGLVREEFLDECISIFQNPQKHNFKYCRECPLERLKNEDMLDPCKGHLKRKFIKECWTKCGCNKYCGNRVVQRGIRCNLQVFWTSEGKGWGLRTLEYLPKGSFVCEYVAEILTTTELRKRNSRRSTDNHSYLVVLDADWGSRALREEEILCLDASFYGNVARFINHRCSDANLIEIPVEVETPNHHYYHVALFTARKVDAFEELTWDYGVDFDDNEHHIKAFRCLCGSKYCRNMKRSSRSRSSLTLR